MILSGKAVSEFFEEPVAKINPAGVDLVPRGVFRIPENATAFLKGNERGFIIEGRFVEQRRGKERVVADSEGFYNLSPGVYEIVLQKVKLPLDATGFCHSRTSLVRLGIVKVESAVWDSGYEGEGMQIFHFPSNARIHKDEAWVQFVAFLNSEESSQGYSGYYQGEKLSQRNP